MPDVSWHHQVDLMMNDSLEQLSRLCLLLPVFKYISVPSESTRAAGGHAAISAPPRRVPAPFEPVLRLRRRRQFWHATARVACAQDSRCDHGRRRLLQRRTAGRTAGHHGKSPLRTCARKRAQPACARDRCACTGRGNGACARGARAQRHQLCHVCDSSWGAGFVWREQGPGALNAGAHCQLCCPDVPFLHAPIRAYGIGGCACQVALDAETPVSEWWQSHGD